MRRLLPFLLLLAGCSQQPDEAPTERRLYAGEGRDRLCIAGERGGFIAYGPGNSNCSVRGRIERSAAGMSIVPAGDEDCRIPVTEQGQSLRLGRRSSSCAYYCGPGADYSGRTFTTDAAASPAVDFAGDPLC